MRREAAWAETETDGHVLELLHEATGLSDGDVEV